MLILKKLIFALPFFLSFALFCTQISPFLQNSTNVLSLDTGTLNQFIMLVLSLLLTGFFFAVFATLANDWKYVAPASLLISLSSLVFLPGQAGIILAAGVFLSFTGAFFFLSQKLNTYLTFQTSSIVVPAIKQTAMLLSLVLAVMFYLQSSTEITAKGFILPPSLIDASLKFIPDQNLPTDENLSLPQISPDQIALLEQNPELLKQYGLDPKILQSIKKQGQNKTLSTTDLVKPMIEAQFQALIKPIQNFVPAILAVLFYFSLSALFSLFGIFLPLFTWLLFWILEKLEFTKYETEQREVKKLVI